MYRLIDCEDQYDLAYEDFMDNVDGDAVESEFERDEEHVIYLSNFYLYILELDIMVKSCIYCDIEEDGEEYPQFDGYIFFDKDGNWLYEEAGSGMLVCIHNYLHGKPHELADLTCDFRTCESHY